jgi:hypothetical protein
MTGIAFTVTERPNFGLGPRTSGLGDPALLTHVPRANCDALMAQSPFILETEIGDAKS